MLTVPVTIGLRRRTRWTWVRRTRSVVARTPKVAESRRVSWSERPTEIHWTRQLRSGSAYGPPTLRR